MMFIDGKPATQYLLTEQEKALLPKRNFVVNNKGAQFADLVRQGREQAAATHYTGEGEKKKRRASLASLDGIKSVWLSKTSASTSRLAQDQEDDLEVDASDDEEALPTTFEGISSKTKRVSNRRGSIFRLRASSTRKPIPSEDLQEQEQQEEEQAPSLGVEETSPDAEQEEELEQEDPEIQTPEATEEQTSESSSRAKFNWVQDFWQNQCSMGGSSNMNTSAFTRSRRASTSSARSAGKSYRFSTSSGSSRARGSSADETRADLPSIAAMTTTLGSFMGRMTAMFEQDEAAPSSPRTSSRSSWRNNFDLPEMEHPHMARPSLSERFTILKQRLLHGDSGESQELYQRFEAMILLRARLVHAQERLAEQVTSANLTLDSLAQYKDLESRSTDKGLRDAVDQLRDVIEAVQGVTHFRDAIASVDEALHFRKLLKDYRTVWDRHLRKSAHLVEAAEKGAKLLYPQRRRVEEFHEQNEMYNEHARNMCLFMDNLTTECKTEDSIIDEVQSVQYEVFMRWREVLRSENKAHKIRAVQGAALYERAWKNYANTMSVVF